MTTLCIKDSNGEEKRLHPVKGNHHQRTQKYYAMLKDCIDRLGINTQQHPATSLELSDIISRAGYSSSETLGNQNSTVGFLEYMLSHRYDSKIHIKEERGRLDFVWRFNPPIKEPLLANDHLYAREQCIVKGSLDPGQLSFAEGIQATMSRFERAYKTAVAAVRMPTKTEMLIEDHINNWGSRLLGLAAGAGVFIAMNTYLPVTDSMRHMAAGIASAATIGYLIPYFKKNETPLNIITSERKHYYKAMLLLIGCTHGNDALKEIASERATLEIKKERDGRSNRQSTPYADRTTS